MGEMRDLARCALTDEQPSATLRDSAEALRIGEAIWQSASSGRRVTVQSRRKAERGGEG